MNPNDYQKVKEIFHSALEIESDGRGAFLDEKCKGEDSVRAEVERLLRSYDSGYLEQPAVGNFAEEIAGDGLRTGHVIGHYTILEKIGSGGMGEVYLAEDGKLGRRVAIKFLPDVFTKDEDRLRRFDQEARTASALNHPNILTIHEIGETDSIKYIATEYIDGETLRQKLNRERLTLAEAIEIAVQTASALAAAHEAGIIHRDIKPENIMLRRDNLVKVLDFGLAKLVEPKEVTINQDAPTDRHIGTAPGMIMGTVQYMSPEQTRGHATDARTDIWSLGVVIYEMLAGLPPFTGENAADLIAEIVKTHPIQLSQFVTEIPERLEEIVAKTLEKNADERYQTAKDLLIDLKRQKRKMDLKKEIERSSPRLSENIVNGAETVTEPNRKSLESLSGTQYVLAGIKLHRGTAIWIFALIAALLLTSAYLARKYWRIPNPNEARFSYASKIRLAAEALETSNLDLAKQLLDATKPKKDEEDLRDFEWGYLARLHAERMASQPITLKNEGWVNSVAFSADSKMLATGSNDARLWDVSTGKQTAEFKGHSKPLVSVAISPDGTKLATGSFDKTAKLWDIATGQMMWTTVASTGTGLAVGRLAFSPDGNSLSGEDDDREIKTWNVSTGKETALHVKFGKIGNPFAVSPDGKLLAAQTEAFFVSVFDIASGQKIVTVDAFGFVKDVVFAPDSKTLLTAGSEKIAKLWSLPEGKEIRKFTDATGDLAFSPNGKMIAVCSKETIKLWDAEKGFEIASLSGHTSEVTSIAFSLDGLKLASGSLDNTARIWNVPSSETRGVLRGHTKQITGISFSHDSKLLASASEDNSLKIWNVETEQVRRSLVGHTDVVVFTAFSPDERTVATIAKDGMIKIWDIATGKQLLSFDSLNHGGVLFYSPNGKLIATANFWDGKDVSLWDAATGDLRCSFPIKSPWGVRFSKDGSRVTASGDKTVKLWDTANCAETWVFNRESEFNYLAVIMPDDRLIAFQVINSDRSLKMIDTESGKELATFSGHDEQLEFADISPNGKRLITSDQAGLIKIWDVATGQELLTIKTGLGELGATAMSPDGKIIATVGGDGTIRLWRGTTN